MLSRLIAAFTNRQCQFKYVTLAVIFCDYSFRTKPSVINLSSTISVRRPWLLGIATYLINKPLKYILSGRYLYNGLRYSFYIHFNIYLYNITLFNDIMSLYDKQSIITRGFPLNHKNLILSLLILCWDFYDCINKYTYCIKVICTCIIFSVIILYNIITITNTIYLQFPWPFSILLKANN